MKRILFIIYHWKNVFVIIHVLPMAGPKFVQGFPNRATNDVGLYRISFNRNRKQVNKMALLEETTHTFLNYRPIRFQEHGVRHTWGASKSRQKMMQWPRHTPVPELKQYIVWKTNFLSCSWKPPRYGGWSDIMFLKPKWSIVY